MARRGSATLDHSRPRAALRPAGFPAAAVNELTSRRPKNLVTVCFY
jgi:hypothetical protein